MIAQPPPPDPSFVGLSPSPPSLLGNAPELTAVVGFLRNIGLAVLPAAVADDALLPGMTVKDGTLLYDPDRAGWVGDLLHEAGHLAVTDPAIRDTLPRVRDDPAEEMATLAWSYAAAMAIDIPIGTLFHPAYKGGPDYLIAAFSEGSFIGLPMLQYWGMTACAGEEGPAFPVMRTWLRTR